MLAPGGGAVRREKSRRLGEPGPGLRSRATVPELRICAATSAGVAVGAPCRCSAAAPATCGAAMEVPLMVLVAVSLVHQALVMPVPGAKMSTQGPQLLNVERES